MDIPLISDDTLQCTIYTMDNADKSVLLVQITEFVESTIPNHIWHRDSFLLTLSKEQENALECTMRVGDSVDDEWLVIFLLWQVTQRFNVAISVTDADGQFLLIEAADVLPSWVSPENVENRVWIYQKHLHIIPLSFRSSIDDDGRKPSRFDDFGDDSKKSSPSITIIDALSTLKKHPQETQTPSEVENVILKRIAGYPDTAKAQLHRTKVAIPSDVAKALAGNPHLIQKAVECFYTRDAIQLRPTQKMSRFPPSTSSLVTVTMTKTAYAQLMGQKFNAPRIFRRPLDQTVDEARWWDNGVKIACGFEMLYQEARTRKDGLRVNGSEEMNDARLDALRRDGAYLTYIVHLENVGYFEGEIRDSKRWKEKEKEAARKWITMRQADDASRPSFAELVNDAIRLHQDAMLHDEGEEPDDWLNVEPNDVEQTIRQYQTYQRGQESNGSDSKVIEGETEEDKAANEQAHRLKQLAEKMEGFVEGEGVLEGALFDDELDSDDDDDDESVNSEDATSRQAAMDALVAPLEPGEYGKMPIHYRHPNTQTVAPAEEDIEMVEKSNIEVPATSFIRSFRKPIFEREKFDGVDSDDETTEEEEDNIPGTGAMRTGEDDEEDEEDQPQIVGDVEVDMGQEEEEFLQFSREALGIDDATWQSIIADREKRGAYIPPSMKRDSKRAESPRIPSSKGPSAAQFFDEIPKISVTSRPPRDKVNLSGKTTSTGRTERKANPDLNSFEAVMDAMETELERLKSIPNQRPSSNAFTNKDGTGNKGNLTKATTLDEKGKAKRDIKGKGRVRIVDPKGEESEEEEEDAEMVDMQRAMDVELRSKLKRELEVVSSDEDEDSDEEMPMDYTLIKNFLESFKAQQGLAGPVGGLAGRLQGSDWALPRDG